VRVAIAAGVLAALYALIYYAGAPLPGRFVGLFGPRAGVERFGGLRMTWRPPPGVDLAAIERRYARAEDRTIMHREGDTLVLGVTGVGKDDVSAVAEQISAGTVVMREVIETQEMATIGDALGLDRHDPRFQIDEWRPETGEATHTDWYVTAHPRTRPDRLVAEAAP